MCEGFADTTDCPGCKLLRDEINRLRGVVARAADLARGAEPKNGWGSPSIVNNAWADGFRVAAVEISDTIAAEAAKGE